MTSYLLCFAIDGDLSSEAMEAMRQLCGYWEWLPGFTLRIRYNHDVPLEEVLRVVREHGIRGRMEDFGLRQVIPLPDGVRPGDVSSLLSMHPSRPDSRVHWLDVTRERETSLDMSDGVLVLVTYWQLEGERYPHVLNPVDDAFKLISETNAMACAYFAEQRAIVDRAIEQAAACAITTAVEEMAIE